MKLYRQPVRIDKRYSNRSQIKGNQKVGEGVKDIEETGIITEMIHNIKEFRN